MAIEMRARHDFVIGRGTDIDARGLWRVDYGGGLLRPVHLEEKGEFDRMHQIAPNHLDLHG